MIPAGFYPASFFSIAPDKKHNLVFFFFVLFFPSSCLIFWLWTMLIFISCFSLFVFLPATELSLLLREMILKLFSEHLSADGKVMLSLMLTECMLLFCKSNSAFGSVPHSVYCCTGQAVCSYEVSLWQTEKTCLQTFLLYFSLQVFLWPTFKVVRQDILTG